MTVLQLLRWGSSSGAAPHQLVRKLPPLLDFGMEPARISRHSGVSEHSLTSQSRIHVYGRAIELIKKINFIIHFAFLLCAFPALKRIIRVVLATRIPYLLVLVVIKHACGHTFVQPPSSIRTENVGSFSCFFQSGTCACTFSLF